jgi:sortase A
MKSKTVLKWSSFIGGAVVLAFSIIVIFVPTETAVGSIQSIASVEQAGPGLPARLTIPKINIDAAVLQVGLAPDGAMDVPKGPDDVAWFNLGKRPGDVGSAVMAGHFGWKNGIPAVFDNLNTLQKGDNIYVEDEKGVVTTFIVREIKTYDQNADAGSVFSSSDGKVHLNLVTCEGVWDKVQKSYSNRLVVFADKE